MREAPWILRIYGLNRMDCFPHILFTDRETGTRVKVDGKEKSDGHTFSPRISWTSSHRDFLSGREGIDVYHNENAREIIYMLHASLFFLFKSLSFCNVASV